MLFIPAQGFAWTGVVEEIIDGDTLHIRPINEKNIVKVRLYGIDAPERQQPYGDKAAELLRNLCEQKEVVVTDKNIDQNGRVVAIVELDDFDFSLQELLVQYGCAWVYTSNCKEDFCLRWRVLQNEALKYKRGLWDDKNPIPPWEWRMKQDQK